MTTYPQFCAVARATEIIGERWTLLIVRDLLLGPRRFTDLRDGLAPMGGSVLTERLATLEARNIVERADWSGPVPGKVYRLTRLGESLRPTILELTRWGSQMLFPERPNELFAPEWLRLVLEAYASHEPTPQLTFAICVAGHGGTAAFVSGGESGTTVLVSFTGLVDASLSADPAILLGAMSGRVDVSDERLHVEGDMAAAAQFASLFKARA